MKLSRFKEIYKLADDYVEQLKTGFKLGDELSRDQVNELDEFIEWKSASKIKFPDAFGAWEKEKKGRMTASDLDQQQIEAIAIQMAQSAMMQLPTLAAEQNAKMREAFVRAYQEHVSKLLQNPEIKRQMEIFMETGDLGKWQQSLSSGMLPGTGSNSKSLPTAKPSNKSNEPKS